MTYPYMPCKIPLKSRPFVIMVLPIAPNYYVDLIHLHVYGFIVCILGIGALHYHFTLSSNGIY
jgi:hypothetical protein